MLIFRWRGFTQRTKSRGDCGNVIVRNEYNYIRTIYMLDYIQNGTLVNPQASPSITVL